jgi:hypothetical protein
MSSRRKFDWRNWVLALVSISITIGLIELVLRILLSSNQAFLVNHHQDRSFIHRNPYWGAWHYPNNQVRHQSDCYDATYQTNSIGIKGAEIAVEKPNIVLLGDSYLEGYGNSNDAIISHFLDSSFQKEYNFLAFGSSGGFGTVNEYALYENFARHYEPELVVLFWLNYNDLYDNLNAIGSGLVDERGNYTFERFSSKEEVLNMIRTLEEPETLENRVGFYTFSLARRGFRSLQNISQYWTNVKGNFKDAIGQVYATEVSDNLKKAYILSEKVIRDLHQAVNRDGAQLVVVNLFDPYQVDEGWLSVMEEKLGTPMDAQIPNKKIAAICERHNIPYLSLYEPTMNKIRQDEMEFPYFNFSCDNHLTKKGNLWVSKLVSEYLETHQLLN